MIKRISILFFMLGTLACARGVEISFWQRIVSQDVVNCILGAYDFEVDDYIHVNDITTSVSDLDSDFSVSLWFKINAIGSTEYLFGLGNSSGGNHLVGVDVTAGGVLEVVCRDGNNNKSEVESGLVSTGVWRNAVLVWDASINTVYGYLDGVFTGSNQNNSVGSATFNRASIGALTRSTTSFFFGGSATDVRVYVEALNEAEILALKIYGANPASTSPTGWWEFRADAKATVGPDGTVLGAKHQNTNLPACPPRL